MKIHVVVSDTGWIINRLAHYLQKYNGWTLGRKPRSDVEANVFFPYLEWRFTKWDKTPSIMWYTHDEVTNPMKRKWWAITAKAADMRVTMARQYAIKLEKYGPTVNISPPVELSHFKARAKQPHDKPVVGVSGWVYPGGRKGEHLVKELYARNQKRWHVRASGRGWPVPCKEYEWKVLPKYYAALDVFLCTSLIEGGPVTVLEALSVGRPVVIPRGVGLLDELPDTAGIWRYEAGNYQDMVRAIERAVKVEIPPEHLHALVQERTVQRYAKSWNDAVASTLKKRSEPKPMKRINPARKESWQGKAGIFLVAYGKMAHDCVHALITTYKRHMPDVPICLVTDKARGWADIEKVQKIVDLRARHQKTMIWDLAPKEWEYIIYSDVDMLCVGALYALLDPLTEGWDMVCTTSSPRVPTVQGCQREKYVEENVYTDHELGSNQFLQYAGGLWSFRRNARTEAFLRDFHKEWSKWGNKDQQAMMRALWHYPVKIWLLGTEWNSFVHHGHGSRCVGMLHFATAARAWVENHPGRKLWREYVRKMKLQ